MFVCRRRDPCDDDSACSSWRNPRGGDGPGGDRSGPEVDGYRFPPDDGRNEGTIKAARPPGTARGPRSTMYTITVRLAFANRRTASRQSRTRPPQMLRGNAMEVNPGKDTISCPNATENHSARCARSSMQPGVPGPPACSCVCITTNTGGSWSPRRPAGPLSTRTDPRAALSSGGTSPSCDERRPL